MWIVGEAVRAAPLQISGIDLSKNGLTVVGLEKLGAVSLVGLWELRLSDNPLGPAGLAVVRFSIDFHCFTAVLPPFNGCFATVLRLIWVYFGASSSPEYMYLPPRCGDCISMAAISIL